MTAVVAQSGELNNVYWPDAQLDAVDISFDNLTLRMRESTGRTIHFICQGYLGYEHIGAWDETIIERAELTTSGAFLDRCLSSIERRLGSAKLPSGSAVRNKGVATQLVVTFIDGSQLNVALKSIRVERI